MTTILNSFLVVSNCHGMIARMDLSNDFAMSFFSTNPFSRDQMCLIPYCVLPRNCTTCFELRLCGSMLRLECICLDGVQETPSVRSIPNLVSMNSPEILTRWVTKMDCTNGREVVGRIVTNRYA